MKLLFATLAVLLSSLTASAATAPQLKTATDWITPVISASGKPPAPTKAQPLIAVFGGSAVPRDPKSPCSKLHRVTLTSEAELDQFTACVQTAMHALKLDNPQFQKRAIGEGSLRWLKSWYEDKLRSKLVVPRGSKLVGKTIERAVGPRGNGVAVLVYLVIDASDRVTAVYAYAGDWQYPV